MEALREALIRSVPRNPQRHLYHVARTTRHIIHSHRPSSSLLLQPSPHGVMEARVQWLWEEGRAGFEGSASVGRRVAGEGGHAKRAEEGVRRHFAAQDRVIKHFKL